jgi:hypothetical protein
MRWGRTLGMMLGVVGMGLAGVAGIARAGGGMLDRPDLLDVWHWDYCDDRDGCYNEAWITATEYSFDDDSYEGGLAGATGAFDLFYYNDTDYATLWWFLYEPDKVTRNDSEAGMNQSDWIAFFLSWYYGEGYKDTRYDGYYLRNAAEIVEGCAGSAAVQKEGQRAKWKIQCKQRLSDLVDFLGVPPDVFDAIQQAVGKQFNKKVQILGKSTENF